MMFLRTFLIGVFAVIAIASTVAQVNADLAKIDTDTNSLTSKCNAWTGTGAQTLAIRNNIVLVINDINAATNDVNNLSPSPTVTEAQNTLKYVCTSPLIGDVQAALTCLSVTKKKVITDNGLKNDFCNYGTQAKAATDNLAIALINKAPNASISSSAVACKSTYDAKFNKALSDLGC